MSLRWWHLAIATMASLAIHGAADFALRDAKDPIQEEGSAQAQISLLGNASQDMVIAGQTPQTIVASAAAAVQPVQASVHKPTETPKDLAKASVQAMAVQIPLAETAKPIIAAAKVDSPKGSAATVQPAVPLQPSPMQNPTAADPVESTSPREQSVSEAKAVSPQTAKPLTSKPQDVVKAPESKAVETLKPTAVKPVESPKLVKAKEPEPLKAQEKVTKVKPQEKKKKVVKPAKKADQKGNKGNNKKSGKAGQADGGKTGTARSAGTNAKGGKQGSAGNAKVSNYPGIVRRKLRRALRYPKKARSRKIRGTTVVRFSVTRSGGITNLRVARGSGSKVLDDAALATVRRAAPFPRIPSEARRKSWVFTVPLEFTPGRR